DPCPVAAARPAATARDHAQLVRMGAQHDRRLRAARRRHRVRRPSWPPARPRPAQRPPLAHRAAAHDRAGRRRGAPCCRRRRPARVRALRDRACRAPRCRPVRLRAGAPPRRGRGRPLVRAARFPRLPSLTPRRGAAMAAVSPTISTTVRFNMKLALLRTGFRLGAWMQPARTVERAGKLFSTPLPSTRERALRASTGDAVERDIETGGRRIRTYSWGDPRGLPLGLFPHGWSSHGTRFLPWVARLREAGYAVAAFDQPAHGRSDGHSSNLPEFVDTLEAVSRHFGPAAAVVGHSLGGAAVALAMARGLAAGRAILIAPAADPVAAARRFSRFVGLPTRLCRRMIAGFEATIGMSFDELQAQHNAPRIGR